MKIIVTGCAGFIGSHLCEKLLMQGHDVIGIDNFDNYYAKEIKLRNMEGFLNKPGFVMKEIDIRSTESVMSVVEKFDMVIHLAAKAGVRPSIEKPLEYIESNIIGTQNLLELMRINGVKKMIFASSSSIYGDKTKVPYSESALVDFPISPYAYTKKACELMLYTYFHLYSINSVMLRFFTVYGPRQRPDLAINKFFTSVMEGHPITVFGDGSTSRDYTYIDDIIQGILSSIDFIDQKEEIYEIINLGNHNPTRLSELIESIQEVVGKPANIVYGEMQPGDVFTTCADISKAQKLLKYMPLTAIQDGLSKYYQWRLQG